MSFSYLVLILNNLMLGNGVCEYFIYNVDLPPDDGH